MDSLTPLQAWWLRACTCSPCVHEHEHAFTLLLYTHHLKTAHLTRCFNVKVSVRQHHPQVPSFLHALSARFTLPSAPSQPLSTVCTPHPTPSHATLTPHTQQELALGSTGSRLARRKALGMGSAGFEGRRRRRALGPVVGGMAEDGTYVGPGGGACGVVLGVGGGEGKRETLGGLLGVGKGRQGVC